MSRQKFDIVISGAGIAGLTAAAGLAARGFEVCVLDPAPPPTTNDAPGSDLRSTAYLAPARALLDATGLWQALAPHATPLDALELCDTAGWPPMLRDTRRFAARELGLDCFGWNVPNWRARALLAAHLSEQDGVDLRFGRSFAAMTTREGMAILRLDDGTRIETRLLIGADGRASAVREAAGIDVTQRRYGQKALAFAVTHERAHENVSREIYNSGGAFTTVPLPDHEGRPASAIVWMNDGRRAIELRDMSPEALSEALALRSMNLLGPMRAITAIASWPVITQTARRLTFQRGLLMAEAAHVLPPIGAQGLNTSLRDVDCLLDLLEPGADPGARSLLDAYAARRQRDTALRAAAIDLFNRVCQSRIDAVQELRLAGLRCAHDAAPLRRGLMRAGLGAGSDGTRD
ncbi:FAD-dependent oxidoreductase [Profundibacterium mesophilum]|uniref:2-octaprenyl-6-methoxyphenol hydroxylase n=1 Tax=Profundibacterium mesophilum KAUST100406-0324 TaxID=1037889 RepID=A0A921TEK0_9RHOB|nr:FAD-dependent oxidoreductase [Profundibacterium mesophilum]KAF0677386.1 2-octaprenyl-6-methoxyphenol hydroxylase [Profundibacterium mesophilum KAUST100406-0324]